jgi:predicted component of type VI protein secretion system
VQALQRFEELVERVMEGSFARLFRSPIQPAEIAKRLEREMEAHPTISVGRTYVPNQYTVTLNPDDFAEFEPFRHSLEHNMAEFISDLAAERGYSLVARPKVTLQASPSTPKRGIDIEARLSDAPASTVASTTRVGPRQRSGTPTTAEQPLERTHAMPRVDRGAAPAATGRPAVMPPPASLKPAAGELAGREFPVTKTLLSIGRGLDNDLVIDDPRVSRHHSQITFRHSHYLLRDLRSTNGTFVNGQPVEAVVLASGDIVSIGGFEMLFEQG